MRSSLSALWLKCRNDLSLMHRFVAISLLAMAGNATEKSRQIAMPQGDEPSEQNPIILMEIAKPMAKSVHAARQVARMMSVAIPGNLQRNRQDTRTIGLPHCSVFDKKPAEPSWTRRWPSPRCTAESARGLQETPRINYRTGRNPSAVRSHKPNCERVRMKDSVKPPRRPRR